MAAAVSVHSLPELRALLAARFPQAAPLTERRTRPVSTGIAPLDAVLPGGGLPRGALTAWAPTGGGGAVLRAICRAIQATGGRTAWVDGSGTITAAHRSPGSSLDARPLLVRPPDRMQALRGTALLLRTGAFALVVLELEPGAEAIGTEVVRLMRAARAGEGAFVTLSPATRMALVRVSSQWQASRPATGGSDLHWDHDPFGEPARPRAVRVTVQVRAVGWQARTTLRLAVAPYDLRDALEPGVDRRGGERPRAGRGSGTDRG